MNKNDKDSKWKGGRDTINRPVNSGGEGRGRYGGGEGRGRYGGGEGRGDRIRNRYNSRGRGESRGRGRGERRGESRGRGRGSRFDMVQRPESVPVPKQELPSFTNTEFPSLGGSRPEEKMVLGPWGKNNITEIVNRDSDESLVIPDESESNNGWEILN